MKNKELLKLLAMFLVALVSCYLLFISWRSYESAISTPRADLTTNSSVNHSSNAYKSSSEYSFASTTALAELPPVDPSTTFTVVVLPDTQNYSSTYPEIFCKQTQWIIDHKKDLDIVFVSQLGDIVNDGAEKAQEWQNATKCLGHLDEIVPYGVIPGNHDLDAPHIKSSGFSAYSKYFPAERFQSYPWYGGNFEGNRNNYEIIDVSSASSSKKKLLFLNLEIEPSDAALAWADKVVKKNPDAYTILTTHKYLNIATTSPENSLAFSKQSDGNTGKEIWDRLVFNNCSIAMVWSGHFHGENRISAKNSCGQDVDQVLQDYQDFPNGGDGWLRVYEFSPKIGKIQAYTYSPYLSEIATGVDSQFSLSLIMR